MQAMKIHLFKGSNEAFVSLLDEYGIAYQHLRPRPGVAMASGSVLELVQSAAIWGALAAVVTAFLGRHRGRKVVITTKDGTVVHAEGLPPKELERVLANAQSLTAIDTGKAGEEYT
ncbi:hypothetical protein [Pigmentiphaga sp.]|uniref:effector-associated constant component EACC1 n=1 Tax=Pigmentiphaga sp. TaxID=1977564 RepID=UPI0025E922F7|nr:hypothetical protein [Pigmentiphaga sp.]